LVNVGENTTLGNGDVTQKLVQLLIVADGELKMTGNNTGLLVVAGSVTSQLEDFGSEVLKDGSEVDGSTGTDTLSVVALSEKTVDTTDRECETSLGGTRLRVLGTRGLAARLAAASHFERVVIWGGWFKKGVFASLKDCEMEESVERLVVMTIGG
jgi:hypothetical protein